MDDVSILADGMNVESSAGHGNADVIVPISKIYELAVRISLEFLRDFAEHGQIRAHILCDAL